MRNLITVFLQTWHRNIVTCLLKKNVDRAHISRKLSAEKKFIIQVYKKIDSYTGYYYLGFIDHYMSHGVPESKDIHKSLLLENFTYPVGKAPTTNDG